MSLEPIDPDLSSEEEDEDPTHQVYSEDVVEEDEDIEEDESSSIDEISDDETDSV